MAVSPLAAARVALGAARIDEADPAWAGRIDLARLDLADTRQCVISQAFRPRSFGDSVAALGLTSRLAEHGLAPSAAARDSSGLITAASVYWDSLEAAWEAEIAARTGRRGEGR